MDPLSKSSARHFQCINCAILRLICSGCDRGHQLCQECKLPRRTRQCRQARRRYRTTRSGKVNHSRAQRRYRRRIKSSAIFSEKIEMDQGSPNILDTAPSLLTPENSFRTLKKQKSLSVKGGYSVFCCSFCGVTVSALLRSGFLRHKNNDHRPAKSRDPTAP